MDMSKTSEREIVNYLTQLCRQSASRFLYIAAYIRNRGLKMVLKTYAQQRLRFGSELQLLFGKNQ